MRTATSDILGYPYIGISSAKSTLKKCTVFSSILVFIHFKLILESCTTSVMYLQSCQTSMMKLLAVVFLQKRPLTDIWQGSKYGSAALSFNIFPLSLFGYLSEYMNICFSSKSLQLIMWRKSKVLYDFHWFQNHLLYTGHGNTKCSYIYTIEMRKSSLWKTSRWNALYTVNKIYIVNESNNESNNKNHRPEQPKLLKNIF